MFPVQLTKVGRSHSYIDDVKDLIWQENVKMKFHILHFSEPLGENVLGQYNLLAHDIYNLNLVLLTLL